MTLDMRHFETPTLSYYRGNKCIGNMLSCWEQDVNVWEHVHHGLGFLMFMLLWNLKRYWGGCSQS
jgi:hypothetical protein